MIIFDLDGTIADCEHRRHFVDPKKNDLIEENGKFYKKSKHPCGGRGKLWKPDWDAFFEACDKDELIHPTAGLLMNLWIKEGEDIEIWSGRSESVRQKTEKWLKKNIFSHGIEMCALKMRPIGDSTPDDVLKEKWLDEALAEGKEIECVFDDRPKVVKMWRRRGIFVFDCNQTGTEF